MKPRCAPWYRPHQWPKWSAPEDTRAQGADGKPCMVAVIYRTCIRCGFFWMKEVG